MAWSDFIAGALVGATGAPATLSGFKRLAIDSFVGDVNENLQGIVVFD